MREDLTSEHPDWLTPGPPPADIPGPVSLQFPINDQEVPYSGTLVQWTPVSGATHYLLQASLLQSYILKAVDTIVTDPSVILPNLQPNRKYYWRVRPFNNWYSCVPFSGNGTFKTTNLVSTKEPSEDGWRCYPSVLASGQWLTVELPVTWVQHPVQYSVFDAAGHLVWQNSTTPSLEKLVLTLPSEKWPAGVYRLVATGETGVKTHTIVRG